MTRKTDRARRQSLDTGRQLTLARLATVALWLLIGVAALSGPLALLQAGAHPARPAANQASPTAASGFAERFVAAFLAAGAGTEEELRPFLATPPSLAGVQPDVLYAARTTVVDTITRGPHYWSVTVAADVLAAGPDGSYEELGPRFYAVGVLQTGGGLVATALPSEVSEPPRARGTRLALGGTTDASPEIEDAVTRFLVAYLASDGELDRYVAPGSQLRPVSPAPFGGVEIARAVSRRVDSEQSESTVHVLAEVAGVDRGNRTQRLQYALVLARREGRWEVRELLGPPPLADQGSGDKRKGGR